MEVNKKNKSSESASGSKSPLRNSQTDRVDGLKVEIVLLPADEVNSQAEVSPGARVMGFLYCVFTKTLLCTG